MLASARLIPLGTIARVLAVSRGSILRWCDSGQFRAPIVLPGGRFHCVVCGAITSCSRDELSHYVDMGFPTCCGRMAMLEMVRETVVDNHGNEAE